MNQTRSIAIITQGHWFSWHEFLFLPEPILQSRDIDLSVSKDLYPFCALPVSWSIPQAHILYPSH